MLHVRYKQAIKTMRVGKNNRILFMSPSVQAGWERQSHRLDFQFIEELGKGSFGVVHRAIHKKTKKVYAIKEIKKKTLEIPKLIEHAKTEVKIMYSLNHPNIIKLYNHFEDEVSIYLVLEFAARGQLYRTMRNTAEKKFSEQVAANYVRQVTLGIQEIHRQKIMHRDIKPENILITEDGSLKVADFGWSHFVDLETRTTFCGTLDYLAPEMLAREHKHDYRVDIWSIGVLIYELCTGESPFSSELIKKKMMSEERVKINIRSIHYRIPSFVSEQCQDLIKKILVFSPESRPSTEEILNHPWVKKHCPQPSTEGWLDNIKNQMKAMFPEEQIEIQNSSGLGFSKEEIYQFSRPDSIINLKALKPKKKSTEQYKNNLNESSSVSHEQEHDSVKRIKQLEMKVAELEVRHRVDQSEIMRLKKMAEESKDHTHCQEQIKRVMSQVVKQNRELDLLNKKLGQSEHKLMLYEKKANRF